MEQYAQRAIAELKTSGDWDGYEEHINIHVEYAPKRSPSLALLLIILRGESPETIPIRLEISSPRRLDAHRYVEEIKQQILNYFASETHRTSQFPKAFTISEVLKHYPEISDWFSQT